MDARPTLSPYVVDYRKTHAFDADVGEVWRLVEQPHLFPKMWPWMKRPRLSHARIVPGARLSFLIDPPLPYTMKVEALFTSLSEGEAVEADIHGDLAGRAGIRLEPSGEGCLADVWWRVELCGRGLRIAARVARPLLMWGHDWAVDVALHGFRRQLRRSA